MTDKHTSGPWRAEDHGEIQAHRGRMVTIRDSRNIHIATVDGLDASVRGQELANARLIAAAPELLKALERSARELHRMAYSISNDHAFETQDCRAEVCVQARAAIKAAKGDA
ncbi:hypothetical protein LCGC14_1313170 [marine sediment metagenome]|uniref:Uncharacterized protein n=1 Tax=marine sediment metagenome TaxID=412755 RepID=A0A0F9KLM1_9ZZZZ